MRSENGKRKRRASTVKHQDRINQLPDDILISIISRLTLREATATSILSIRWRYLCTYITHLIFPPFKPKLRKCEEEIKTRIFPNYVNTIDRVLDSHKGSLVKEFRVRTHCLEGANIDKWFEFSSGKQVEIIDIQLEQVFYQGGGYGHYSLHLTNLIRGLKCLTELSLCGIDVDDGEMELLFSNCSLLESLSIVHSETLRNVSIVRHSTSKLKHLEISYADNLQSIVIDNAVNLVSLKLCRCPKPYFVANNVPKLIEISTSDEFDFTLGDILSGMPSLICQLRTLKLLANGFHMRVSKLIKGYFFYMHLYMRLLCDYKLNLETLSRNLRRMKLSGFLGSSEELKLAFSILENVYFLHELVVEVCDQNRRIKKLATDRARLHFRPTRLPYKCSLVVM